MKNKFRMVYSSNAHGKYVAHEQLMQAGPSTECWVEIGRTYEREMLFPYPTELETV